MGQDPGPKDSNDGNDGNDGNGGNDNNSCNEGKDRNKRSKSDLDTSGQQHDNAEPTPREGDATVNVERQSKDSVSPELEDSRGSEGLASQTGKKRRAPSGDHSDDGSNSDSDVACQIKLSNEPADGPCSNNRPGQSAAGVLAGLQCVKEYRTPSLDKGGTPYFELECLGQDGQWYWIAESDIQRSVPSAVGTFWGCGPEDWRPPETEEGETGREVWKRPLATEGDGVPDALLIMGRKTSRSGQTKYLTQKVGYPAAQPVWNDETTVKEQCAHEYEIYRLHHTDRPELTDKEERQLSAIVGHRLNGEKGSQKGIQFSCQWTSGTETWEAEDQVQRKYNAAVLTYWQSDPKARRSCKVPDRRLQILGHEKSGTRLLLNVQMVGRSSCDGCAVCGSLPCRESSNCAANVPLEPVERLLREWPKTTKKYLEDQGLASYNTSSGVKRRSKRLPCRREYD